MAHRWQTSTSSDAEAESASRALSHQRFFSIGSKKYFIILQPSGRATACADTIYLPCSLLLYQQDLEFAHQWTRLRGKSMFLNLLTSEYSHVQDSCLWDLFIRQKFPDSYSVPRTLLGAEWDVGRSTPARETWETIAFFLSAPCLLMSFLLLVWRVDVTTEAATATMPTWEESCGIAENLAWDSAWVGFLHTAHHTREKPTQTFR